MRLPDYFSEDGISVLFYLYDHKNETIKKGTLRNEVIKTYAILVHVLDNLEKKNLIYVEPETVRSKGQVVKILPLGEKLVIGLRELDNLLFSEDNNANL